MNIAGAESMVERLKSSTSGGNDVSIQQMQDVIELLDYLVQETKPLILSGVVMKALMKDPRDVQVRTRYESRRKAQS